MRYKWILTFLILGFITPPALVASRRSGRRRGHAPSRKSGSHHTHESNRFRPGRGKVQSRRLHGFPHTTKSLFNAHLKAWWNSGLEGHRGKGHFNPYLQILTSHNDMVWSREFGWHSQSDEDEYHVTVVEASLNNGSDTRPWKGEGSFTGDLKLHCLQNRADRACSVGIVLVYHRELEQWGTICGDNWHAGDAEVVCNFLGFRTGKALRIGPGKQPPAISSLSTFLKNVDCNGGEWTLTDCTGDALKTNYTCRTDKLAGVKCTGTLLESGSSCQKSETQCKDGDRCVDPEYICDGMADCPWGTDEIGCTGANCKNSEYWCGPKGGGCISNEYLCDGEKDCIDGNDERDCEQCLNLFEKTAGFRRKTKRYELQWEPVTPYLCAQKCKDETAFVCTAFDYFRKFQRCRLYSPKSPSRLRKSKNWDYYERQGVEDCIAMNKHRCDDGSCIRKQQVCNFRDDCPNGEDEKECEPLKLRLRGGSGPHEGRVEAAKGTKYGQICDTHWTLQEANVVCRQLNYSRGAIQALKGGAFQRSSRKYVLDNVRCRGDESNLEDCSHDGWMNTNCKIDSEVGVVCINDEVVTAESSPTTTTRATTTPARTTRSPSTSAPADFQCGVKPAVLPIGPMARIVGGRGVEPNEWPWQVGIWLPWTYWCGGSLIHPCWVLTAAHCFMRRYPMSDYTIRLGDHLTEHQENTEQEMKIARLIKHDYNATSKENDIALIQIVSESGECATLTDAIKPVCIPRTKKQFKAPKNCTITGWGKLSSSSELEYNYILQEATVPLIPSKKCGKQSEYGEIKPSMFCAGYLNGGIDSCQGDSGGPLACQDDEDHRYYVWGIVSWGNGCARPKAPGVYANVALYRNWIRETTGLDL